MEFWRRHVACRTTVILDIVHRLVGRVDHSIRETEPDSAGETPTELRLLGTSRLLDISFRNVLFHSGH
jgi:hypothetical protein